MSVRVTEVAIIPTQTPFDTLRALQVKGFFVIPIWGTDPITHHCLCFDKASCKAAGKHPNGKLVRRGVKDASNDPEQLKVWIKGNPGGNWGIAGGTQLPDGRWLYWMDVDTHDGNADGREVLQELEQKHSKLPHTIHALTGADGDHYAFSCQYPPQTRTLAPSIDIRGVDSYIVCAPSLHKSGKHYTWDANCHPDDTPIAASPDWVLEGTSRTKERPHWTGASARETLLGEAFELAGMLGVSLPNGVWAVRCPWFESHSDGRGDGNDSSTVILPPIENTSFGGWKCSHRCATKKWDDVLNALPAQAVVAAKLKYPLKPKLIKSEVKSEIVPVPPPEPHPWDNISPPEPVTELIDDNNQSVGTVDNTGKLTPPKTVSTVTQLFSYTQSKFGAKIISDLPNAITMLTYDEPWKQFLLYDEFSQQIRFARMPPPWHPDDMPANPIEVWQDQDTSRMVSYAKRMFNMDISKEQAYDAVQIVARRFAIHPVRTWLNALSWDGKPRVTTWLSAYIGAEESDYTRSVGTWWLVSAVARIMRPGCKSDCVLILEGEQGERKSTALCTLASKREWFSDTPIDIGNKDSYLALRGKWIVELAEVDSLNRADTARAKAFFSSEVDTFRAPYGRETISVPRQVVFAGSVNHNQYLKDDTGNRRYWPVRCGQINLKQLRFDTQQIWAEAVMLYGQGQKWWPDTPEEYATCTKAQIERAESDVWTPVVATWLDTSECMHIIKERSIPNTTTPAGFLTTTDVLDRAVRLPSGQWNGGHKMRAGKILRELGFTKKLQVRRGDKSEWVYAK